MQSGPSLLFLKAQDGSQQEYCPAQQFSRCFLLFRLNNEAPTWVKPSANIRIFQNLVAKSSCLGGQKSSRIWTLSQTTVTEKAEEPEIKLPTSARLQKKQGNSRKTSTSASMTMLKTLTVWITTNCGKFLKRWEYQTILPEKPVCRTRSNSQNRIWNN